ncbi:hypothetical protein [Streptomyces hokutonensis]|uniref:hypothetical protein n=1 Tax=Streptomyces hokutonensis TaxID=1306990 RepID=UPI00036D56D9|nr:hypothetical protein [Streptomyces hokutonensis]
MYADDHRGRQARRIEKLAPACDPLSVTGEHDRPGRTGRDVDRDLPAAAVVERLGDQFSRCRVRMWRSRHRFRNTV